MVKSMTKFTIIMVIYIFTRSKLAINDFNTFYKFGLGRITTLHQTPLI